MTVLEKVEKDYDSWKEEVLQYTNEEIFDLAHKICFYNEIKFYVENTPVLSKNEKRVLKKYTINELYESPECLRMYVYSLETVAILLESIDC